MHEKILAHYQDELKDTVAYMTFSQEAGDDTVKCICRDIAHDEYSHAKALKHLLEKHGWYTPTDELKRTEAEAQKAIESFQ